MLEDIQRLPRSISESTDWTPDWRDRQAMAYLAGYRDRFELRAGEGEREAFERALGAGMIRFPVREDDPVVKARFRHLAGAAVPGSEWTAAFDWCQECVGMDPSRQSTIALKGWLLAGLTDEEITRRRPMTPCAVRVFHDVWFDVRPNMQVPGALIRILCGAPLPTGAAGWQRRERAVFHAALFNGAESVDRMLIPDDRPAAGGNDWYVTERRRLQREINRRCGAAARRRGGDVGGPAGRA